MSNLCHSVFRLAPYLDYSWVLCIHPCTLPFCLLLPSSKFVAMLFIYLLLSTNRQLFEGPVQDACQHAASKGFCNSIFFLSTHSLSPPKRDWSMRNTADGQIWKRHEQEIRQKLQGYNMPQKSREWTRVPKKASSQHGFSSPFKRPCEWLESC